MSCLNLNIFVLKCRYGYNFRTIFLTVHKKMLKTAKLIWQLINLEICSYFCGLLRKLELKKSCLHLAEQCIAMGWKNFLMQSFHEIFTEQTYFTKNNLWKCTWKLESTIIKFCPLCHFKARSWMVEIYWNYCRQNNWVNGKKDEQFSFYCFFLS